MVGYETIEKHALTLEQIGLLQLLHTSEVPLSELLEKYDMDGLRLIVELKEKGLLDFDLETDSVLLLAENDEEKLGKFQMIFESFRKQWPNKMGLRGHQVEFSAFKKNCGTIKKRWQEEIMKLTPALLAEKSMREHKRQSGQFVPEWPMLQTWINQKRWTAWSDNDQPSGIAPSTDPMHEKYMAWYAKTYGTADPDRMHAMTAEQYADCRNFTGQMAKYKGKVSADRMRAVLGEAHHAFFLSGRSETIYSNIVKILG